MSDNFRKGGLTYPVLVWIDALEDEAYEGNATEYPHPRPRLSPSLQNVAAILLYNGYFDDKIDNKDRFILHKRRRKKRYNKEQYDYAHRILSSNFMSSTGHKYLDKVMEVGKSEANHLDMNKGLRQRSTSVDVYEVNREGYHRIAYLEEYWNLLEEQKEENPNNVVESYIVVPDPLFGLDGTKKSVYHPDEDSDVDVEVDYEEVEEKAEKYIEEGVYTK
jgi:hypothetical protein